MTDSSKLSQFIPAMFLLAAITTACNVSGVQSATPSSSGAPESQPTVPGSPTPAGGSAGIFGHLVGAWGNPPANMPATKCVKVFDASGTNLVTEGTCTGMWRNFRVPLEPGPYVVEFGGHWERAPDGSTRFVPERRTVQIQSGQWMDISPPGPPGPVP